MFDTVFISGMVTHSYEMMCKACNHENTEFQTNDLDGIYDNYYMHYDADKNIIMQIIRPLDVSYNSNFGACGLISVSHEWPHQWVGLSYNCVKCDEISYFDVKFTDGNVIKIIRL